MFLMIFREYLFLKTLKLVLLDTHLLFLLIDIKMTGWMAGKLNNLNLKNPKNFIKLIEDYDIYKFKLNHAYQKIQETCYSLAFTCLIRSFKIQ